MIDSPNPRVKAVVNDSAELPCQAYVASDMLDMAYIWLQNGLRINMEKQPQFSVVKHVFNVPLIHNDSRTFKPGKIREILEKT